MSDINFDDDEQKQKFYDFMSLFENNPQEESSDFFSDTTSHFVENISEEISTDYITDLKRGIYSLFVNLINNQVIELGPEGAVKNSIDYLEEIIYNFKQAINKDQE